MENEEVLKKRYPDIYAAGDIIPLPIAASLIGVSRATIGRLTRPQGPIKRTRLSTRRYAVTRDELIDYLERDDI